MKKITKDYAEVLRDPRCNFYGNVRLGDDVLLSQLRELYSATVLAYGAEKERSLGIPGEHLIAPATDLVNWYNGAVGSRALGEQLLGDCFPLEHVVVIGNGNVAIDVCRMLLKSPQDLAGTDMPEHAVEALARLKVKRVTLVGRRGVCQSSFTTKELRELSRLPELRMAALSEEIERSLTPASWEEMEVGRTTEARAVERRT